MSLAPTGTATFLFTDIEGSTRLWETRPEEMRLAIEEHNRIIREAVARHGGQVFSTAGDSFSVAFLSGTEAVAAALAVQVALKERATSFPLFARMAIHTGEAEQRGGDYVGRSVNRTARLMALARGGEVLLSNATAQIVVDTLPSRAGLVDLGEQNLKDLDRPERVFRLTHPDLRPVLVAPAARRRNNLPSRLTSFIGREQELTEVGRLIGSQRLVTLSGVGGVGKSSLALRAAEQSDFEDGVWWVELAPLESSELIVPQVAKALGLPESPDRAIAEVLDVYLTTRRALVVLDNCEHLIDAAASFVEHVLRLGPGLRVLATSRQRLGVPGEAVWPVPPLDMSGEASDAVRLFADRAALADPGFSLGPATLPAVIRICARLNGIPLALELAAARLAVLDLHQISQRLDDMFHLLTSGDRTEVPRHRTLQAALDWSYQLLDPGDRVLFRRLAQFQGGFDLEAAESVAGDDVIPSTAVLDGLARLVDASMVVRSRGTAARYLMLEPVRQYAADRLAESGEQIVIAERLARYFAHLTIGSHDRLQGDDQERWFERFDAEADNLRTALRWGMDNDLAVALTIAAELGSYWIDRGHHTEARRWVDELLGRAGDRVSREVALVLLTASELASFAGNHNRAADLAGRAESIADRLLDGETKARVQLQRAHLAWDVGRCPDAVALFEEAVRQLGLLDSPSITYALKDLGLLLSFTGEFARGEALLSDLRRAVERHRQPDGEAILAEHRAVLTVYQGQIEEGWGHMQAALPERRRLGRRGDLVNALRRFMWAGTFLGYHDEAEAAGREALAISDDMGYRAGEASLLIVFGRLGMARGDLSAAREAVASGLAKVGGWRGADWTMFGLFEAARVALAMGKPRESVILHGASAAIREEDHQVLVSMQRWELDVDLPKLRELLGPTAFEAAWSEGLQLGREKARGFAIEVLHAGSVGEG